MTENQDLQNRLSRIEDLLLGQSKCLARLEERSVNQNGEIDRIRTDTKKQAGVVATLTSALVAGAANALTYLFRN